MNKDYSIRIHGRGGQGIKTFATFIAESAIKDGSYAQAFPEFGPERRGAPVIAYVRISSREIITRSPIEKPDFVVILDESVMKTDSVREGIASDTLFLINTPKTAQEIKKEYSFAQTPYRNAYYFKAKELVCLRTNQSFRPSAW